LQLPLQLRVGAHTTGFEAGVGYRHAWGDSGPQKDIVVYVFRVTDIRFAVQAGDEVGTGLRDA
jgi:hypothetical protein